MAIRFLGNGGLDSVGPSKRRERTDGKWRFASGPMMTSFVY